MQQIFKQIHSYLSSQDVKKILIVPHKNPDGDAVGSATAFLEYLHLIQKEGIIFCATSISAKWSFLRHSQTIISDPNIFKDPEITSIVVLDSSDLRYAGIDQFIESHSTVINIDHHATNELFGHHNLVIPTASSTTEVLYNFFKNTAIIYNQHLATSLLTGFITDTDSFSNAATSAEALAAASELVRFGARLNTITSSTVKNKSVDTLRLWGIVLARLKKNEALGLSYTYITKADLQEHSFNESETDGIANFLNNLGDTKIALILKETVDGYIKGSLRTIHEGVDVSELAKKMGGGGHKKAAGFTTPGTIEQVLQKLTTNN